MEAMVVVLKYPSSIEWHLLCDSLTARSILHDAADPLYQQTQAKWLASEVWFLPGALW